MDTMQSLFIDCNVMILSTGQSLMIEDALSIRKCATLNQCLNTIYNAVEIAWDVTVRRLSPSSGVVEWA